jgi:hypothetical protein
MTTAQQWAHKARLKQGGSKPYTLPEEYKQHTLMFDKKEATCFPPTRKEELNIEFLLGAPKEIDCKVYLLS